MAIRCSSGVWWRWLLPLLILASSASATAIKRQTQDPPQKPLVYRLTPKDFNDTFDRFLPAMQAAFAEGLKPSLEDATFENTIQAMADLRVKSGLILTPLNVYPSLGDTQELRQGANKVFARANDALRNVTADPNLYARVEKIYKQFERNGSLDTTDGILAKSYYNSLQGSGGGLPAGPERDRLMQVSKEMSDNEDSFNQNVNDINATIFFTREELDGVKAKGLDNLVKGEGANEGMFGLDMASASDTSKVQTFAKRQDVRQRISITSGLLVPENVDILRQTVGLRDEYARLLNYTSFADAAIGGGVSMASNATAVTDFLADLQAKLYPKVQEDLQEITEYLKRDNASAEEAYRWDSAYYRREVNEKKYNLSSDTTDPWFPAENTVTELLKMYSDIYSFDFRRVEGDDLTHLSPTGNASDLFWHDDVQMYTVWEASATDKSSDFVGYLYLDLYDRDGKSPGAYMFSLEPGYIKSDGDRHYPTAGLGTNFKKALNASETPSLLGSNDMTTIMHELGHCMHHLSCLVRYASQCGPNGTPTDFTEMPSQMMENFWFEPVVQKRLSKHWSYLSPAYLAAWQRQNPGEEQPPETIPDDITDAVIQSRTTQRAMGELGQVFYGEYDMTLHTANSTEAANKTDVTFLWNKMSLDIQGIPGSESLTDPMNFSATHGETQFTHIMGGYEAGYYAYQWSKVYAKDVFYSKFQQDPFNGKVGREYRDKMLAPGGSKNLTGLFVDFLGREPTPDAFYKDLGLEV